MNPQPYIHFAPAIQLAFRFPNHPRVQGEEPEGEQEPRTLTEVTELPVIFTLDPVKRYVLALLSPIPNPVVLYGPSDFAHACGDEIEDHIARIHDILGADPQTALQALIDEETPTPYWEQTIPPRVPLVIDNWRGKAVLAQMGLLATVEASIAALPEEQRVPIELAWNSGAGFARKGAAVQNITAAMNLTSEQVDQMFIDAAAIEI